MPSINRNDISEEVYWVWECPKCKQMNDAFDESEFEETAICEGCHEVFTVIDD